ncbi:MAG TPA: hypothetical protein VGC10_03955 [Sphingomonas sp.]
MVPIGTATAGAPHRLRGSLCLLLADRPMPAALREISGAGAWLETNARPAQGTRVTLRHPDAGSIEADVVAHDVIGLRLAFARNEEAVAFALAVIAADMSRPD